MRADESEIFNYATTEANLIAGATTIQPNAPQNIDNAGPDNGEAYFDAYLKVVTDPNDASIDLDDRMVDAPDAVLPSAAAGATFTAGDEPWIIGNAGRFYRTGDILRVVMIGPRLDPFATAPFSSVDHLTVADVWSNFLGATTANRFAIRDAMLDLEDNRSGTPTYVNNTNLCISHAGYLVSRFTTLETNRALVPGRPNINTMPERYLGRVLPTVNTNGGTPANQAIAQEIRGLRETVSPGTGTDFLERRLNTVGIQNPGQLAYLTEIFDPSGSFAAYDPADEALDFNEYEPDLGGPDTSPGDDDDRFINDREEQTRLFNYLNQTVSVRSDVYTAYVLVRAYPGSDFTLNGDADGDLIPDPTSEYRLIATFDRSKGKWTVVAVKRLDDQDLP